MAMYLLNYQEVIDFRVKFDNMWKIF